MPLDPSKRFDELLKDNPYAAEYGYSGSTAEEPDFSHLLQSITATTPAPTGPDLDAPDFSHLLAPIEPDTDPAEGYVDTPTYHGPTGQSTLGAGVNTATRRLTAGALNVAGGTLQGLARDPLGPIGWIPGLSGLADAAQPEEPIGWLQGAGQWAKDTAASPELAAPPGWAGGWTDTIASAAGSTIPFVATAAIPGGAAVSISSGAILGSYAALDEQVQEAIRNGATEEQIKKASRMASTGGLTEPVPLEIIFNRIPLPGLAKGAVQIAGRLLAKAAAEGGQEAVQTAIQNFSENYVYNPDQDLTEGLAQAFGIGAIVGTGFAVPAELAAGKAAPAPAPAPGVTPPAAGVTTPAGTPPPPPSGGAPGVTPPAPSVTTPPVIPSAPTATPGAPSVIPPPAPIAADEDALPDLLPMPEEEEESVVPEPAVAPVAELPAAPEQPELPLEAPAAAAPAATVAAPAAPAAPLISTPPLVPEQQQPLGPTAAPAAALPEQGDAEGVDVSHLLQPIGTRRIPAPPQYAGDRVNLKATDAQRQARNAEIGHYRWQSGINVGIEVPAGGMRRSVDLSTLRRGEAPAAVEGQLPEGVAYGRIKGTRTRKPEIKTFIGSTPNDQVFLIDQIDPTTGKFDEPKVMLDFQSMEEARNAYISSYSDGRGAERIGSISQLPVADFRAWLKSPRTQRPFDRKAVAQARRARKELAAGVTAGLQRDLDLPAGADTGANLPTDLAVVKPGVKKRDRTVKVPPEPVPGVGALPVGNLPDQGTQAPPDNVDATTQFFGNKATRDTIVKKGFGALKAYRQRTVVSNVLAAIHNDEVLQRVIQSVPVDVMNNLVGQELAAQPALSERDVLVDKLSASLDPDLPVTQSVARFVEAVAAGVPLDATGARAEGVLPPVLGRGTEEGAPALLTGEAQHKAAISEQPTQEKEKEHAPGRIREDSRPHEEGYAVEGGKKPSGGRVQSAPSRQPSDRAPQREEEQPAQQEGLGRQAQDYVLERGRKKKVEVLRAIDANGNVIAEVDGKKSQVRAPPALSAAMRDPKNSIVVHHNHPASTGLSPTDIGMLGHAGLHSVWAHGHDGTVSRASATEALRERLKGISVGRRFHTLLGWTKTADRDLLNALKSRLVRSEISADEVNRYFTHLLNTVLHNAGLIDYASNIDASAFIAKADLGKLLDALATATGKNANVEPRTTDRYADRRTPTLRHRGDVGATFGRDAGAPEQRRREEPADQVRPADTRRQEERQAPVAPAPAPAPDFAVRWDKLPLEQKEAALKAAKVARSPITRWKDLGEANQQKLQAAEPEVLEERRPPRLPDPGATFVEPEETRLRRLERKWAYSAEGMAQIDKALAATGAAIPEQFQLGRAEILYSSRAGERGEQLKQQREEPLLKALADTGRTHEEFDKYLIARHAQTENARLRAMGSTIPDPTGMSDADAAAILASAPPEFAALAQQVYAISDETLLRQLQSGLISQEVYDELKARPGAENWVTLRGWADAEGEEGIGTGRGFDLRSPEWKMRKGRTSMADSPLAYTLQNAYTAIARSEKNRVAQVLYWMAQTFKNDKVWTVDRAKKEKYKYTDPKTGAVEIRERWMPPVRVDVKNTVVVRVKGIPHYISIYNQPLLEAMRNMGAEETNKLLRGMATVLRTIGKLYTTYSPNFFIVNPIRDLQTAVLQMSEEERKGLVTGTLKKMPSASKGVLQYLNGRPRPPGPATTMLQYAHDFAMDGGKVSWLDIKTIEQQKRRLARAISPNRAQKLWDASRLGTVLETMENLNSAAENAVRLALYTELRQNHGYSRAEAAKVAKEITTNFNRKGTYGPVANSLYMFFNARVQGAVRTGRFVSRVARNPRKHPIAVGALAMLPAMGFIMDMWNYAMGGDDDDGLNRWDHAVPQYEKEKSFVMLLPGGGDKVYKFPLSFGYNAFFVLGQQLSAGLRNQMGLGEGTEPVTAAFNAVHAIINATSPVDIVRGGIAGFVPTLAAPFVEMGENRTYRGAPIYPTKYDPKSSDADLFFRSTGAGYKEVAKRLETLTKYDKRKPALVDLSPESLQHLANTYLGGAGQFVLDQVGGNAWKILSGKASEIEVRDIPFVRSLVGSTSNEFVRQNMYYEAWDQVDYLHRSMTEEGITSAEKKQLKEKYPVEAGVYRDFESAEKRLREQRAKRKKIDNNPRLSSTERQRRLDAVEKKMDDIRTETLGDYAEELKRQRTGATLH